MTTRASHTSTGTLSRELVHKASNSNVFLTSMDQVDSATWQFGVRIPWTTERSGRMGEVSLAVAAETFRQCGLAMAHAGLGVPTAYPFTMQHLGFSWTADPPRHASNQPYECIASISVGALKEKRGIPHLVEVTLELHSQQGVPLATGSGVLQCLTPSQYQSIRIRAGGIGSVSTLSASELIQSVSISPDELTGVVSWNVHDPFQFDHPTDHIPGIVLLEASLSGAQRLLAPTKLLGFSIRFQRFGEFTPRPTISVTRESNHHALVSIKQHQQVIAQAECHAV